MCREKNQQLQAAPRCKAWFDPGMKIAHFLLDFVCKQSVSDDPRSPDLIGSRLLSPASAVWPPRGCGGGGAVVRRHPERSHEMAKRKAQTSAKPRSGTKTRSKVKRAKPIGHHNTRAKSKQAAVVAPAAGCYRVIEPRTA
jgi:hypothetical protein